MGKRKGKVKSSSNVEPRSRWSRFIIPGVLGLAVVVGVATWYLMPRQSLISDAAQYQGGPRLAVDKELIDFGSVPFERMVEARFRLRNVGDQPLRLAVDPRVEAVEGC